jgi:hypothetical protein
MRWLMTSTIRDDCQRTVDIVDDARVTYRASGLTLRGLSGFVFRFGVAQALVVGPDLEKWIGVPWLPDGLAQGGDSERVCPGSSHRRPGEAPGELSSTVS